ncbi:fatty acid desaturase [Roseicella frigidaeris]|nr:fatty acid desaturase [Roseicella frigidaeris]
MAARLPRLLQPFLTWLTAKPAPGEVAPGRSATAFVLGALAWIVLGCTLAALPLLLADPPLLSWLLLPAGWLATCCGLGLFQVVVFHHCSHGTVLRTRAANRRAGRLISALLLFKRFEDYQREHMLHHSPNKLLTEEDEFADFVLGMCGLEPGLPKRTLWRRVLVNTASPVFHWRFLQRRLGASMFTGDRRHDLVSRGFWLGAFGLAAATGTLPAFLLAWVLPVTVLLQMATVFRILCEHRFPEPETMQKRDRNFVCHATAGVFPGVMPPELRANTLRGACQWAAWWAEMLTVHLFARIFVLVGDAPCHDFHHRKPATRRWADYIHARQQDLEAGSPGFPAGYFENWGLFQAIDHNLASLAATPREALGR